MAHGMTDGAAARDAPGGEPPPDAVNRVLAEALAADKREGLRLAVRTRWIALAVIALLLPYVTPGWDVL